jgi:hypothetical protein
VVGSTAWAPAGNPPPMIGAGNAFPFSHNNTSFFPPPVGFNSLPEYVLGVIATFKAPTAPQAALVLESSSWVGSLPAGSEHPRTVARDVAVARNRLGGIDVERIVFVGSTDDAGFLTSFPYNTPGFHGFQQNLSAVGARAGFLVQVLDAGPPIPVLVEYATYFGLGGDSGLTGISTWSEYPDHLEVSGFTTGLTTGRDFLVGSVFRDTSTPPALLRLLRHAVVGGALGEVPAAMGLQNATTANLYEYFDLGPPAGGGIAVEQRARVAIVGSSDSFDYPSTNRGQRNAPDAVHTRLDMLPAGVSRTDGTGTVSGGSPPASVAPFDGGTTPTCGLAPFGLLVGMGPPEIRRMLIDYEGPAPSPVVNNAAIVLDRLQDASTTLVAAGIQVGFPSNPPVIVDQMEIWLNNGPVIHWFFPPPGQTFLWTSFRFPLGQMPASPATFTIQIACALNRTFCGSSQLSGVASPALTINY